MLMKTYRGSLLLECLVALSIISVILVLFVSARPKEVKGIKEEAGVIFMGVLLGEMRDSSETQLLNHLSFKGDVIVHLNHKRLEKKRTYLPEGIKLIYSSTANPTFNIGLNYSFIVNQEGRKSGELIFVKDGQNFLKMMINFGSYIIDLEVRTK